MGCCSPGAYGRVFSERWARLDARRYRVQGLDPTGRRIVEHLAAQGLAGATVLEVGGGIGALGVELLDAGAERVVNVELSPGYERTARGLLERRGLLGRVDRLLGDVATTPELARGADVVVLHRVVCCYPDADSLVDAAASRAGRRLVLSFPRDAWWNRVGFRAVDRVLSPFSGGFRTFVRPAEDVLHAALARGFASELDVSGVVWRLAALRHADAGAVASVA
jgi:magnesium-protoporphyrin O-methyltransferase